VRAPFFRSRRRKPPFRYRPQSINGVWWTMSLRDWCSISERESMPVLAATCATQPKSSFASR
jgi:hypothetical protein